MREATHTHNVGKVLRCRERRVRREVQQSEQGFTNHCHHKKGHRGPHSMRSSKAPLTVNKLSLQLFLRFEKVAQSGGSSGCRHPISCLWDQSLMMVSKIRHNCVVGTWANDARMKNKGRMSVMQSFFHGCVGDRSFGHALALESWVLLNFVGQARCFAGICAEVLQKHLSRLSEWLVSNHQ